MVAEWLADNWVELVGACTGITYLILEIKQNMWLWPIGLLNAVFYAIIFFSGGLYAITTLQLYYIVMMIYGWWYWARSSKDATQTAEPFKPEHVPARLWIYLIVASLLIWVGYYWVLIRFTDSTVPIWDAMTTSMSIVGTWMLAKKYIEQWWVWIAVNIFSVGLYYSQGLHVTAVLYAFYAAMAVVGLIKWRKSMNN